MTRLAAIILALSAAVYLAGQRADRALTKPGVAVRSSAPNPARTRPAISRLAPGSVSVPVRYRGKTAREWAMKYKARSTQYRRARAQLRQRWQPTVTYALRLASAVFGVSYWEMYRVSACESNHFPGATNGRYKGLFQLGWSPFGLSPYDPVANALSAAQTVRSDGSWRQWECKP